MIVNQYLEQNQEQRLAEALNAVEIELDKNTDIYGAGELDAIIGKQPDPKLSANRFYRQGDQDNIWQFYAQKYGIELETEF